MLHFQCKHSVDCLGLCRASYYNQDVEKDRETDLELMRLIDREYLEHPFYGSRRMTEEGTYHQKEKVQRLMQEMGLEAIILRRTSVSQVNQK